MAVLPVIKLGHPTLRKVATPYTPDELNDELRELINNMIDTMRAYDGIGLAAPQINIPRRMFVIDTGIIDEESEAEAFINPEIIELSGSETMEEGCLSIPDVRADIQRPDRLKVRYWTIDGDEVEEEMEGLLARVFQHELDHLNGILFIDHLSFLQRKLLEPKLRKIREENQLP
jgi:peptide deformylase